MQLNVQVSLGTSFLFTCLYCVNPLPLESSYVLRIVTAILMAGHGAFERWLNPKCRAYINGVNVLISRNLGKSPQSFQQMEDMARRCFL